MTVFHHRCVTMVCAKMASTISLVTAMWDLLEGCVMSILMIVRVGTPLSSPEADSYVNMCVQTTISSNFVVTIF